MPTNISDRTAEGAIGAAVVSAAGLSEQALVDLVGLDPQVVQVATATRQKPRSEWSGDEVLAVRKYDNAMHRARQIAMRDEAKSSLAVIQTLMNTGTTEADRTKRLTRSVLIAIAKEVGLGFRSEVRDKDSNEVVSRFASELGGETGLKMIADIGKLMVEAAKAFPAIASRDIVFEGNVSGVEIVEAVLKLRPNAKAKDQIVQQTIRAELGESAPPAEESAE